MSDSLVMLCNVLNSLPNSVIVIGKDGKVIDANQAACLTHGVDSISELSVTDEVKEALTRALTGEYCQTEYKIVNRKTGKELWLKARCNPVYTNGETPAGVSLFEKDVTSQKQMINELKSIKLKG